jgi:predicted Zn-dependent peptidase
MKSTFHKTQLKNGLVLLGETNPSNVSTGIGFFVKTGARDEVAVESGLSHFLEHMMFKGTPKRNAVQINMELGNLGAQANAFTSEENTVYYAAILPERFSEMQELLSDMLRPTLDPEEFEMEKKVILEEIARYQDRPNFYLFESALKDYFGEHSGGNSVLGTLNSVSALTPQQMRDYFDRRYTPSNIALVATGNFNWERFVADAEDLCGNWVARPVSRAVEPFAARPCGKVFRRKKLNQGYAFLMSKGPSAQDIERYPMAILATMLGDSSGSRMYWELIHTGIAETASADNDERDGLGCFSAYVSAAPSNLDSAVEIAKGILSSPLEFSDDDLDRAKAKVMSRIVLDGELPMGRLMALGLEWNYRQQCTPLRTVIERVKNITKSDIEAAVERFPLQDWGDYRLLPE